MKQIIFSPTGGTKRVADILSQNLGEAFSTIDLSDAAVRFSNCEVTENDIAVIAVPSYGGRVPELAAKRLLQIKGNGARAVIVCVYGNRAYEDTLVELQDVAEKAGFKVAAAVAAVAEHSIMHQYASGRPDAQDEAALRDFSKKIQEHLRQAQFSDLKLPGNRPYKKATGIGLVPKAGKACNECGLCAKQCPAQAISKDDLKCADPKKCIACMRCVTNCPRNARKVSKVMVSAASMALKKACSVRKECELYI